MEKKEPSFTASGNISCYSHCGNSTEALQNTKNRLTTWPSNPSSGYLHPKFEILVHKDTCTSAFIAALFTMAKTWRKPESLGRWLDKEGMVHAFSPLLLNRKKRWNTAIHVTKVGSWVYHAKKSKSDRKNQEPYDFTPMWDIKLKATKEQTRKINTQKLIDMDDTVAIRGKGVGSGKE